jgi:formylglycine-generating enzyme
MKTTTAAAVFVLGLVLEGCGTTGNGTIFFERSVNRNDVTITRVAIVPNRLPLNLQDPEKWRLTNWGIAKNEFEQHGIQVVDYKTSVNLFDQSGLPIEDTKSSRDKYADLANTLNVDAVVIPYYGTFASVKNVFFIFNGGSYVGVATFQIYLRKQNDFFTRVDCSGENYYTTGILMMTGVVLSFVNPTVGLLTEGVGVIYDLVLSLRSSDSRWEEAFTEGIHQGLAPFFVAMGRTSVDGTKSGAAMRPVESAVPARETAKNATTEDAVGLQWIRVDGGKFPMGGPGGKSDQLPVHEVALRTFRISATEVTFDQYDRFCALTKTAKPSDNKFGRGNRPVIGVSWNDAVAYCTWASGMTGSTVRLPSEAEWEYAARGGNKSRGYIYSGSNTIDEVAWYSANTDRMTSPVGTLRPNELGIFDMTGNVLEWCSDWYGETYYASSPKTDPKGPATGSYRVLRGGSWTMGTKACEVAYRQWNAASSFGSNFGFRVVQEVK